jgi:PAS domain S-box-containing protein
MLEIQKDGFLSSLLDALDVGLIVLDVSHRVVAWNEWIALASGIAAKEAIGCTLEELFSPVKLTQLCLAVSGAFKFGTSSTLAHSLHPAIFPLKTPAGRVLIHDVMVRAVSEKPVNRCLIQISNVTVAVERERVLRERQNARYDAIVDGAMEIIITIDAADTIQFVNPAASRHFGYSARELVGQPASILFEDRGAWREIYRAALSEEEFRQPVEVIALRRDGSSSYLELSLSRWMSQSRVFVTAILRDVNERRTADEALRVSEAQFRSMAQAVPNHVWTAPANGELDWFNDRVYEYSGAKQGSLNGEGWREIVHPDDISDAASLWYAALAAGTPYETQFRLRRADGSYRWHIARAFPITGGRKEVTHWVGSNTDIEDQKNAAQVLTDLNAALEVRVAERTSRLMQAEEALRQSQKMEAIGQLTGGVAHDFNNLLQGIIGALSHVKKRISEGRIGDLDRFLNGAIKSANRAAALTHRLLAFSRRQPVDPRPVNVNELISTIEELLRRSIGEAITLTISADADLWLVRCDSNQLENAVLNLAINARDAMPDGGSITIETTNKVFDERQALRRELSAGDFVCLSIGDSGAGMSPDVIARAFEPFFTTKPIGQGTGLGLSMIYGFVRQSDGAVRIDSAVGVGTTVEICLPRYEGQLDESPIDAIETYDHSDTPNEIVLVVEDEGVVRLLIVDALADLGYRALEAAEGAAALRILQSPQRVDLLITDIGLPGLNGRQLADAARLKRPNLKVLFMTGYAESAAGRAFLEPEMEIIAKPFTMEVLAVKVREMIKSARPLRTSFRANYEPPSN